MRNWAAKRALPYLHTGLSAFPFLGSILGPSVWILDRKSLQNSHACEPRGPPGWSRERSGARSYPQCPLVPAVPGQLSPLPAGDSSAAAPNCRRASTRHALCSASRRWTLLRAALVSVIPAAPPDDKSLTCVRAPACLGHLNHAVPIASKDDSSSARSARLPCPCHTPCSGTLMPRCKPR